MTSYRMEIRLLFTSTIFKNYQVKISFKKFRFFSINEIQIYKVLPKNYGKNNKNNIHAWLQIGGGDGFFNQSLPAKYIVLSF